MTNPSARPQAQPFAIIAGDGPGLGMQLLKTLTESGYRAIGLGRQHRPWQYPHYNVDLANVEHTQTVLADIIDQYGVPQVVIHNTAQLSIKPFVNTSATEFTLAWQNMVLSAFHIAQFLLPKMAQQGSGTWLTSGATASLRGGANFSAFSSAKFALRGLTQSLARTYQSQGIHVAHIVLDGILDTAASREMHHLSSDRMAKLEDIAASYLYLINQAPSAWTHELDLRPMTEAF